MATLFAIVYPSKDQATSAFDQAKALENAGYMRVMEQALISKDDSGEIKIGDENHPVLKGAGIGALVGVLTGAIFLIPVAGLALGAAVGGLLGRHGKSGAEEDFKNFQQTVTAELKPGSRALVVGSGPIGLGVAFFAKIAGADVTVIDAAPDKIAPSKQGKEK